MTTNKKPEDVHSCYEGHNCKPESPKLPVYSHRWGRDGERCEKCGDKDWMGGPCSKPDELAADSAVSAREFIACKRTEKSSWQYGEYSEEMDLSFDAIAPDAGNYCKVRLIEYSAFEQMRKERDEALNEADYWHQMADQNARRK